MRCTAVCNMQNHNEAVLSANAMRFTTASSCSGNKLKSVSFVPTKLVASSAAVHLFCVKPPVSGASRMQTLITRRLAATIKSETASIQKLSQHLVQQKSMNHEPNGCHSHSEGSFWLHLGNVFSWAINYTSNVGSTLPRVARSNVHGAPRTNKKPVHLRSTVARSNVDSSRTRLRTCPRTHRTRTSRMGMHRTKLGSQAANWIRFDQATRLTKT